jgi:hypothetical protein
MYSLKLQFNGNTVTYGQGGSFVHFDYAKPYFIFEFADADYTPTALDFNRKNYTGTWTQVSSSPNRWKLEIENFVRVYNSESDLGMGLAQLFYWHPHGPTLTKSCKLIEAGDLNNKDKYGNICESMDRIFAATSLTSMVPIQCTTVKNVNGMFQDCTNVESGALDQYNWFLNYGTNINVHAGTFKNCGSATETGLAELEQIPFSWGGKLLPPNTIMTTTLTRVNSRYILWSIGSNNNPIWTDVKNGMYLFTEGSVSKFEGVSMNRTRIFTYNGLGTKQGSYALYFYPAFIQATVTSSTIGQISWCVTTDQPNDKLDADQGNTDMAGTMDFNTYGPMSREYGTYDSNNQVYFAFLVTNTPIEQWTGLTDAYGFLWNANYNPDAKLRWFFDT